MSPGGLWAWWRGWMDRREPPLTLGLLRLLLGALLVIELLDEARLGLAAPLRLAAEDGGLLAAPLLDGAALGLSPGAAAWAFFGVQLACAAGLLLGLAPRASALGWVLLSAALSRALPQADRGVDMLLRNVILLLAAAEAGAALSLPAALRRQLLGPLGLRIPAWPRQMIVLQVILVYCSAGWSKLASPWTPVGGWSALSLSAQDPAYARLPAAWVVAAGPLTQLATALSWLWEWSAPALLLAVYFRDTRTRPGHLRAAFNRLHLLWLSLGLGAAFHLGTHLMLRIGAFPFVMIVLYVAFIHPDRLVRAASRRPVAGR